MLPPRVAGLFVFPLTVGCVGIESAPPRKPPQIGATPGGAMGGEPATPSTPRPAGRGIAETDSPNAASVAPQGRVVVQKQ